MTQWSQRSREERMLLNPAFCATLLWHAAKGRESENGGPLSIEEAFLILALVLPSSTRDVLPSIITTSLAVWINDYPMERKRLPERARALLPFTRTAITFGVMHDILNLNGTQVRPTLKSAKEIKTVLTQSSDEVRVCAKKAEFIGRWFAKAGTATTVLALLGVRP